MAPGAGAGRRPVGRLVLRVAALGALALGALPLGTAAALAQDAAVSDKTLELEFWRSVSTSSDPEMYDAYLQQFPNGTFAPLARVKAAALRRGATSGAAAAPATPPAPAIAAPVPVGPAPAAVTPPPATAPSAVAPSAAVAATAQAGPNETAAASLLASLAAAQETPTAPAAAVSAPAQAAAPVPQDLAAGRPQLETVPAVVLPAHFCSAEERNAFHAQTYRPAGEAAEANNGKAIAYLQSIQARYDAMAAGDADMRNALAKEARDYKPIADAAFQAQQALVRQFDALMAVPITSCGVAK